MPDDKGNGEAELEMPEPCSWCSGETVMIFHTLACPRVIAIEYHANGKVKRVELAPMKDEQKIMQELGKDP